MAHVLTLNGGSSSIRFAVFAVGTAPQRFLSGKIDRIGMTGTSLTVASGAAGVAIDDMAVNASDRLSAAAWLLDWVEAQTWFAAVGAVGHRVVHGMHHTLPERVTPELLAELVRITPYDPEHLPGEIELIESMRRRHPRLPQVACFDTAFHRSMPPVATMLAIPRRYAAKGVQRYGFHGLSYTYLLGELRRIGDPAATRGRVILAHLGSGASLAAIRDGLSIDTSMGFTPAAGVMMSTRCGDIDPGVANFLASTEAMDAHRFQTMTTRESGLLGVSETSADIRDLLAREGDDLRAAEAVGLFCYQIKKYVGAFAAALGGVDTLVFAGGIGENSAAVRTRICCGLEFLGIRVDPSRNARHAPVISDDAAPVAVRVIRTDEEYVIVNSTLSVLGMLAEETT